MSSRVPPEELPVRLAVVRKLILERCEDLASATRAARLLERLEQRLRQPPRVVLLGEANSGKTTIANMLIGVDLLATDLVRNTRKPVRLRYASATAVHLVDGDGDRQRLAAGTASSAWSRTARSVEVSLPLEPLQAFEVIDTPGLGAEMLEEARRSCRSAHAAIWCTTAQQAWKASEVALWSALGGRLRRHAVLAVTQAGHLDAADREKVRRRLEREAGPHFAAVVMVTERAGTEADGASGKPGETSIGAAVRALAAGIQRLRAERATGVVHRFADALATVEPPAPPTPPSLTPAATPETWRVPPAAPTPTTGAAAPA